jgi:hypothetical protein
MSDVRKLPNGYADRCYFPFVTPRRLVTFQKLPISGLSLLWRTEIESFLGKVGV